MTGFVKTYIYDVGAKGSRWLRVCEENFVKYGFVVHHRFLILSLEIV